MLFRSGNSLLDPNTNEPVDLNSLNFTLQLNQDTGILTGIINLGSITAQAQVNLNMQLLKKIYDKLDFDINIPSGVCKIDGYNTLNTKNAKTVGEAFTGISTAISALHANTCLLDTSQILIPDNFVNFTPESYYLELKWGLKDDPLNPKYWSRTQIISPVSELQEPNKTGDNNLWNRFFEPLEYTRGTIPCSLWCRNFKKPFTKVYAHSEDEGLAILNKIVNLTSLEFDKPKKISYGNFSVNSTYIKNAGKIFKCIRARVIFKKNGPTDLSIKVNDFYPPQKLPDDGGFPIDD